MAYLLIHTESTRIVGQPYKTESAAKAAATRLSRKEGLVLEDHTVMTSAEFIQVEKTKVVKNLMTGELVTIPVNTPRSCDPSTELFWSM
jgi:hypothetical protein